MDTSHKPFIFLSYGHDRFAAVALRLKADLEVRGFEVWFDQQRLKPGLDWERYIQDGIDQVAAAGDLGKFLLLLTPHSVRLPDGFCLNELACAFSRHLAIIPVMLEACSLPLAICRLQYLDMRACLPPEAHPESYEKALNALLDALASGKLDFQGGQNLLESQLQPTDFSSELRQYLSRFSGREWVFAKLDRWVSAKEADRIFWITADPGTGKSALAAKFADTRPQVAALHFCRFGHTDTTDPRRVLMSLAYQIAMRIPDYQEALVTVDFAELARANAETVFDRLFLERLPAENPESDRPALILVDGLDEATDDGENPLANLLARDFLRTPDWLRLLITSRPETEIREAFQATPAWLLENESPENQSDARKFIATEYAPYAEGGALTDKAVEAILARSQGLFLYLEWALNELARPNGTLSLNHIEAFPTGLGGVYDQFFKRQFGDMEVFKKQWRPVLEVVVAAREPLAIDFVARLFQWTEYDVNDAQAALGTLFIGTDGRVRPFHKTLLEWLTDKTKAFKYQVSANEGHQALAERGWTDYASAPERLDPYFLRHLPAHLAARSRFDDLEHLLVDFHWIETKLRNGGVFSLLADYRLLPNADEGSPPRRVAEALRLASAALSANPDELPSQLMGRLRGFDQAPIQKLLQQIGLSRRNVWLNPLTRSLIPPGTALIATLAEPLKTIAAIGFSTDGQTLVYACHDRDKHSNPDFDLCEVKVWPYTKDDPVTTICPMQVDSLTVTPDGTCVAIASQGTVSLWPILGSPSGPTNGWSGIPQTVIAMAFAQAGQEIILVSKEGEVQTWDLTRTPPSLLRTSNFCHAFQSIGHSIFTDHPTVAVAADRGILFIGDVEWRLDDGVKAGDDNNEVAQLAISPPGNWFRDEVDQLAFTPSGDWLLMAKSIEVEVWKRVLVKMERAFSLPTNAFIVNALAISADGKQGAVASGGGIKVWDLTQGESRDLPAERSNNWAESLWVTADGRVIELKRNSDTIQYWNLETLSESGSIKVKDAQSVLYLAPKNGLAGIATLQGLCFLDLDTGASHLHPNPVPGFCVAVTADATRAISIQYSKEDSPPLKSQKLSFPNFSNREGTLLLWEIATGQPLLTLDVQFNEITSAIAVFPDGSRAAVSSSYEIKVFDLATGHLLQTLVGHSGYVDCLTVSNTAAGWRIISGSRDQTVRVWDPEHPEPLFTLSGHTYTVSGVQTLGDGRRTISCCGLEGTLRIWDILEGRQEAMITTDVKLVLCAISPDRKTVVAGDMGGQLHVFQLMEL